MSTSKYLPWIVGIMFLLAAGISIFLFLRPGEAKETLAREEVSYEDFFAEGQIMDVNVVIDEESFQELIENPMAEQYVNCHVEINGEMYYHVGLRTKGNTSLSQVASSDSDRYSFKIEFDHYQEGQTMEGLDKLILNNIFSDKTYVKEYMAYDIFQYMGVAAPYTCFANISFNGEKWGLYLAIEGMEEAFAQRVYGLDYGQLYKPESEMGFRGGPFGPDGEETYGGADLVYNGEEEENYKDIFDNASFDIRKEDKTRLINALKYINAGEELEKYMDVEQCLRYFAAQTFIVNLDSYYSNLKHNYYLYEKDGQLTILPWDLNLAFGGFQARDAKDAVNNPIDTPMTGISESQRPLFSKLMDVEEYKEKYHSYLREIGEEYVYSGKAALKLKEIKTLISPYVKEDPTAFYTYEEFLTGIESLEAFILARADSVLGQLDGVIPSTQEGQKEEEGKLVEAKSISLQDMGVQGGGNMGDGPERGRPPMKRDFEPGLEGAFPKGMERGNMPPGMPRQEDEGMEKSFVFLGTSIVAIVWGILVVFFLPRQKMNVHKKKKNIA